MTLTPNSSGLEIIRHETEAIPKSKMNQRRFPAQIPRFLSPPASQVVKAGGTVTFECLVLWAPKGQTTTIWTKEGQVTPLVTSPRIFAREAGEVRQLTITGVEPSDRGVYGICIENSHGRLQQQVTLDVIVRDKMKPICCSMASSHVIEPTPLNPGGQKVNGAGRASMAVSVRKELISMNNHPLLPPTFLQHLSDAAVEEGKRLELTVQIRGAAEVLWLKNEQLLPNSPYFKYVSDRKKGIFKLVISDPFVQDSGLYTCEANNQAGGSITFATVTVTQSPPKWNSKPSKYVKPQIQKSAQMESNQDGGKFTQNGHSAQLSESDSGILPNFELPTTLRMLKGKVHVRGDSLMLTPHVSDSTHSGSAIEVPYTDPSLNMPPPEVLASEAIHPRIGDIKHPYVSSMSSILTELPDSSDRGAETQELAKMAVAGIIEFAEHSVELAQAEVHEPPFVLDHTVEVICSCRCKIHAPRQSAPKAQDVDACDGRHDSGIIAGLDAADKSGDDEEMSSLPMSSLTVGEVTGLGKAPTAMGPSYLIALKGEPVFIRIKYSGNPHPRVEWTKNSQECDGVEDNSELSTLSIAQVGYDDSGRYVAKISNDHGILLHHCFLHVEGPPLPPSTPPTSTLNATSTSTRSISISWSGSPYDGGSILKAYIIQVSVDEEEWTELAAVNALTFSLTSPRVGGSYRFRVACQNMYGTGPPSEHSVSLSVPVVPSEVENAPPHVEEQEADTILEEREVQIRRGSLEDFYAKGEELGKGRFGTVFNAKRKETGEDFAGKIVRCIKQADKVKVRQEVEIMNSLRHPKLLQILDALENDKEICIITEKINGGELFERVVADDNPLTEFDCIGFLRQICDGVRFMHQRNIIHLDLKPENILCLTHSTYNIKIIDFGLSQKYDSAIPLRVLFGTPEFIAPEIINYEPISPASDMWAVGVITYVLLSGLSPFMGDTDSDTFSNITQGLYDFDDESFDAISEDAKDFISKLLVRRQEKRLSPTECLEHKWLAYPEPKKNNVIQTDKLKRFIIRRKWQKTGNAIRALGRMTNLSRKSGSGEFSSLGSQKSDGGGTENKFPQSASLEEESEDVAVDRKRQLLQRQQRVDSSHI